MSNYVLVQGGNMTTKTWNKLSGENLSTKDGHMGAKYWDGTVQALESEGHRVFSPELSDEYTSDLSDHIHQIIEVIIENDLNNVILVGHSYGGFVITGVADSVPERIGLMVYVDTGLPDPGQSMMDLLDTVYSSHDRRAYLPDPNPPYVEKLEYNPKTLKNIRKIYIRCTKSEFIDLTRISKEKIEADNENWIYLEIASSHVPMADMKQEFYDLLLNLEKMYHQISK